MKINIFDKTPDERGVSPVIATILLVAITVILVASIGVFVTNNGANSLDEQPQHRSAINIQETAAGSTVTAQVISQDVSVKLNGVTIATLSPEDGGKSVFVPTAPGDEIQVIASSESGGQSLLLSNQIDQREGGEFIAYYDFTEQTGDAIIDRSGNGNDGELKGSGYEWVEDGNEKAIQFKGTDGYAKVDKLNLQEETEVEEFTIASKVKLNDDTGDVQQVVEHRNDSTNFEWYLETNTFTGNSYNMQYKVRGDGAGEPDGQVVKNNLNTDDTHVLIGTYDGDQMKYYVDGTLVGTSDEPDRSVEMGRLFVGADAVSASSQHLDGNLYEMRLYYTSLNEDEVKTLNEVMENENI